MTVKVKALVPLGVIGGQAIHAGDTVSLEESRAVDLASVNLVTITGSLSSRGSVYQSALATYLSNTTRPVY